MSRIGEWQTRNPDELKRQLAELEKQLLALRAEFDAYRKAHP
jgi:ribosomal protein L29